MTLRQLREIHTAEKLKRSPATVALVRAGDHYYAFDADSLAVCRSCNLTLSTIDRDDTGFPIFCTGFPHHMLPEMQQCIVNAKREFHTFDANISTKI